MVINLKQKIVYSEYFEGWGDFFKNFVGLSKHPKKTLKKLNF